MTTKAEAQLGRARAEALASTPQEDARGTTPSQGGPTMAKEAGQSEFRPQSVFETAIGLRMIESDNDTILVDLINDKYFRLNTTGSFIWRLVMQRLSLEEIGRQLSEEFHLAPERAFNVAATYIRTLVRNGLAARVEQ